MKQKHMQYCMSTPGCRVVVFRTLAPVTMNPLQGKTAAKEKEDSGVTVASE